jgi:hypothetical protein
MSYRGKRQRIGSSRYAVTPRPGSRLRFQRTAASGAAQIAAHNRFVGAAQLRRQRNLRSGNGTGRERKTYDPVVLGTNVLNCSSDAAVAVSGSGYITNNSSAMVLNQVPQGTTSTTRIGRKIRMTAVHILGRIMATTNGAIYNPVRIAIVYIPRLDRTTTTMPPQNVIWTSQSPHELRVLNNADRFKIVRQWTWDVLGDRDAVTCGCEALTVDKMVKLDLPTVWTQADTSGSFDDMEEGGLCLYVQGIQSTASGNNGTFTFTARVYFEDL